MGFGGYDRDAHTTITSAQAAKPVEQVFTRKVVLSDMDPRGAVRESRDSANHPTSVPIIFGLDLTGSMDDIPKDMARKHLPDFMKTVIGLGCTDPQLLLAGVGDTYTDEKPLQVGQFESTGDLMNRWLTSLAFVCAGGANGGESYHLVMEFAANHTVTDAYEKRGKKGFLFLFGDDHLFRESVSGEMEQVFGTNAKPESTQDILARASEKYHVFFVIPDRRRAERIESSWRQHLGDNVIVANNPDDVCGICGVVVALTEGYVQNTAEAAAKLKALGVSGDHIGSVITAIEPYATSLGRATTRHGTNESATGPGRRRNGRATDR